MTENDTKQKVAYFLSTLQSITDIVKEGLRASWKIVLVIYGYYAIVHLAGKQTEASFFFGYFTSQSNDFGLPWFVGTVACVWGFLERRLRLRKVETMQAHIKKLEIRLDPNRSTSGLTSAGQTNPRDAE